VERPLGNLLGGRAFRGHVGGTVPNAFARGFAEHRALLDVVLQGRELMIEFPGLDGAGSQLVPPRVLDRPFRGNEICKALATGSGASEKPAASALPLT
jgi:hypothetical protein